MNKITRYVTLICFVSLFLVNQKLFYLLFTCQSFALEGYLVIGWNSFSELFYLSLPRSIGKVCLFKGVPNDYKILVTHIQLIYIVVNSSKSKKNNFRFLYSNITRCY